MSGSGSDSVGSDLREFWYSSQLSSLRQTGSEGACASGSVSISLYIVLCIVLLWECFGGLSSAPVALGGVGRTCDSCSFSSVLGEWLDWVCCLPDLELADLMLSVSTWRLHPRRCRTRGADWLRELACGCLDLCNGGSNSKDK